MTNANVTIYVTVYDEQALWKHAYAKMESDTGTQDQGYVEEVLGTLTEPNVGACLQMIFDPGESPPGVCIIESTSEIEPAF